MTGLAPRKITTAALLTGSLAIGLLAPTAAGALTPGQDHGGTASTVASAPATGDTPGTSGPASKPAATATTSAAYVNGKVVSSVPLRIRSSATTNSTALGSYAPGTIVKISCKVHGQNVAGNDLWYKLYNRSGWLAARYVQNLGTVPFC